MIVLILLANLFIYFFDNFNSIIDDLSAFSQSDSFEGLRPTTLELENTCDNEALSLESTSNNNVNFVNNNNIEDCQPSTSRNAAAITNNAISSDEPSLAAAQLTAGLMQAFSPPLAKARSQLKELM